jgi:SAM-dependent methyltransferase/uncharacterized protein YbaR (Trm112 family)
MSVLDGWTVDSFLCPIDRTPLSLVDGRLVSQSGRQYPIVDGIPVFLSNDVEPTIGVARMSLERAIGNPDVIDWRAPDLYLESVSISDKEKVDCLRSLADGTAAGASSIDPVVLQLIGATNGLAYKHLIGDRSLAVYPIPDIDLPKSDGNRLLDVGCSWGRWCLSAARKGYSVVGVDPSLGAVMAARRVAKQLGLDARFLVADGRHLPFPDNSFDQAHSFSVLQHLSKENARKAIAEVGRVLKPDGSAKIQMPNGWGIRSIQNQARRRFSEPTGFDVRFYSVPELRASFTERIGPTSISTHCFFGVGWLWSDYRYLQAKHKPALILSECLTRLSRSLRPLVYVADSVFCASRKIGPDTRGKTTNAARRTVIASIPTPQEPDSRDFQAASDVNQCSMSSIRGEGQKSAPSSKRTPLNTPPECRYTYVLINNIDTLGTHNFLFGEPGASARSWTEIRKTVNLGEHLIARISTPRRETKWEFLEPLVAPLGSPGLISCCSYGFGRAWCGTLGRKAGSLLSAPLPRTKHLQSETSAPVLPIATSREVWRAVNISTRIFS